MDPNSMGFSQSDGGQMNAGSMAHQQGQNTGNSAGNANFMSSLMGQLSQMQQQQQQQQSGAPQGGLGGAGSNQVPLLVGASPFQQQLSALQGLTGGQTTGQANNNTNNNNNSNLGGDQSQGQQQANQGFPQSLFFGAAQGQQGQAQGFGGQQGQQPQSQQAQGQMQHPGAQFGMMQNPLLGGNLGFNVQQLQQLQLAQQLMAAGLPPQLAFGGSQPLMGGGLGMAPTPQLSALSSNPAAVTGLGTQSSVPQATATPNVPSSNAGAAASTASEPSAAKAPSVGDGQDWAEPFSGKGKKEPPFPLKLHQILSNPEFQECICWNPHGRSWRILKPPVFEQLVIPLYFRHAKYASFMRQVNGWGFKRIVSGNDHNSYYHEMFLRDYPQLCLKMKRIRKGDKLSEAIEEGKDEKSNDGAEGNEAGGGHSDKEAGSEGKEGDSDQDGSDEPPPPSDAVKAMLDNANSSSSSVGLTSGGIGQQAGGNNMNNGLTGMGSGNNQNQAMNASNFLSSMASQLQNQQGGGQQSHAGQAPSNGGIPGLDNTALLKLQEALQGGGGSSLLQQQQNQSSQQQMPSAMSGLNMGNLGSLLQGNFGGALAAQLQAATQPSQQNNNNSDGGNNTGVGNPNNGGGAPSTQTLQEMVAQLQQQQQQNSGNSNQQQTKSDRV